RSYASYEIAHPKNAPYYDVYDDTRDQMYVGMPGEAASSTAAVKATQDPSAHTAMVLRDSNNKPAFTQFSSSDGGWTVSGGQPYLPARRDPYDGLVPSSVHSWAASVSASTISAAFGNQLGTLRSIVVTGRDGHGQWGGRISTLTLRGSNGNVSMSGATFRYDFGLRSEWFHVLSPPGRPTRVTATVDQGTATVGWQPPPSTAGAPVTGYRVTVNPGGQARSVAADARTASFTGLSAGTDYTVAVVATSKAGPGYPTTVTTKVHRLVGANGVGTAIAVSQATFGDGQAGAVVLTRRTSSPDALAAGPLAAARNAPVLVTSQSSLLPPTRAEIQRVLPAGGRVYLLGGPTVVSDDVRTALVGLGYKVTRYAGATPAGTARIIARSIAATSTVTSAFEVSVDDYAAAWAAGPAAVRRHGVVLLTNGTQQSADTTRWLARHPKVTTRYAVGAAAAKADPAATALVGSDAADTAVMVARAVFGAPRHVGVVSPDHQMPGLLESARLSVTGGPMLFASADHMPAAALGYLSDKRSSIVRVDLVGRFLPYDNVESDIQRSLLG
ncbi:MAG: hypothetical protein QOF18_558, partial [Frankiaceae bacterium]|nr:hypothetical protein [Frankiaceae bacterium]